MARAKTIGAKGVNEVGDALKRVVSRAISDAAFRRQLQQDPKAALKEFNLSAAEITALTSGDATKLTALGIDQRMSRMFGLPTEVAGGASRFDAGDASYAAARIEDQAGAGGPGAQAARVSVDATSAGGSAVSRIDPTAEAGSATAFDPSTGSGTGPDGLDLDRLATDASAPDWAGRYGTDRLERMEGSTGGSDVEAQDIEGGDLPTGGADHTQV